MPMTTEEMLRSLRARQAVKARRDAGAKPPVYEEVVVPEELGPIDVLVDEARVKSFAFSQDDYHPWHFGASPFGHAIGHAAILANDLLTIYYTAYDRHRVVGLHTEESLHFHSPIEVGETAKITGCYVDKYERDGRGYVVLEARAVGQDGRLLVSHRGIEIMRVDPGDVVDDGNEREGRDERVGPQRPGRIDASYDETLGFAGSAEPGLDAGAPIAPIHKLVSSEQMAIFSLIGEFQRNIHTDLEVARRGGLETTICQGQQQAAFLAELCTRFFGAAWFASGQLRVKFIQPLYANSLVTLGGRVASYEPTPEGERLHLELWIDRGQRTLTAVGWASALLPPSARSEDR